MRLLPDSLHIDPDYDISQRDLLKAVLETEVACLAKGLTSGLYEPTGFLLGTVLENWTGIMHFNPIKSREGVRFSLVDFRDCEHRVDRRLYTRHGLGMQYTPGP